MNLTERREAVRVALCKAKRHHRPTSELQRKYNILTAGILAEKIAQDRAACMRMVPPEQFELCSEADPELWTAFCTEYARPITSSQVWTVFDVMMALARRRLEFDLAGDPPSRLPQ